MKGKEKMIRQCRKEEEGVEEGEETPIAGAEAEAVQALLALDPRKEVKVTQEDLQALTPNPNSIHRVNKLSRHSGKGQRGKIL